mmetsp:Transcript_14347/g.44373  ORF Transcript_14347/g.44373 Transcript_14347/m.44373 type:complete len:123 (-) Transcript_14347:304-672(-)
MISAQQWVEAHGFAILLRRKRCKLGTNLLGQIQEALHERVARPENVANCLEVLLDQRIGLAHLLARRRSLSDEVREKAGCAKREVVPLAQSTLGIGQNPAQQCERLACCFTFSKTLDKIYGR